MLSYLVKEIVHSNYKKSEEFLHIKAAVSVLSQQMLVYLWEGLNNSKADTVYCQPD